jgi:HEAT repeats
LRSVEVEQTLRRLIEARDDLGGDSALSALAVMGGVPGADDSNPESQAQRNWFLGQLRARLAKRPSRFLGYVLCVVASPDLLPDALSLFSFPSPEISYYTGRPRPVPVDPGESDLDRSIRVTLLAQFADALPDDEEVQDTIWHAIYEACQFAESGIGDLRSNSNLVRWCNSPAVLPDVTDFLRQELQHEKAKAPTAIEHKAPAHHFTVYLAASRLQDALRPRQLQGWQALNEATLQPFRAIAQANTHQTGYHLSSPMRAKEAAWQTLMLANAPFSNDDLQQAVSDETSGHVQGKVMEIVAPVGCDPLPPVALDLLAQKGDLNEGNRDNSRFSAGRGAETLARATATRQAFSALLDFGFVYNGEVLRSTSDALDDVAVALAAGGDLEVVWLLFEAVRPGNPLNRRIVSASALLALAAHGLVPAERWRELLALGRDEEMQDFYASLAVQAVGLLSDPQAQGEARDELILLWRESKEKAKGEFCNVANRAHEALARHGTWRGVVPEGEFLDPLFLELRNDQWRLRDDQRLDSDLTRTLTLLYHDEPAVFEQAVADTLWKASDQAHYALTVHLCAPDAEQKGFLKPPLADIMLRQLREQETSFRSRLYLFEALAVGAPVALLDAQWSKDWDNWRSEARIALADALGLAAQRSDAPTVLSNATFHLGELLRDGSYPVRRAACRALGCLGEEYLREFVLLLASSENVEERRRGAEAAFWLPEDIVFTDGSTLRTRLRRDRERVVRQAVERAETEHQERRWANSYLDRITQILPHPERIGEVLPYGAALVQLGDDSHLHLLSLDIAHSALAPRVRIWLGEIHEALERKWQEKTQKWPEPWLQWGGIIEELSGALQQGEDEVPVIVRLWQRPRVGVRGTHCWGGILQPTTGYLADVGEGTLALTGRKEAQVLISHQSLTSSESEGTSSWALFFGQNEYPTPES